MYPMLEADGHCCPCDLRVSHVLYTKYKLKGVNDVLVTGKTNNLLAFFSRFKLVNLEVRSNYMLHFLSYNYHIYNVLENSLQSVTSTVYIAVELRITLEN